MRFIVFPASFSSLSRFIVCFLVATVMVVLMSTQEAAAQHAGDVYIDVESGQIVTGLVDEDEDVEANVRVYESEFGESGVPGYSDEPGWEAFPGTFDPGSRLGWNALAGVQRWNGTGFDSGIDETITVTFGTLSFEIGSEPINGFDLLVATDGSFHRHLGFFLDGLVNAPEVGIYMVELELYTVGNTPEASKPFWIVFNNEDSEEEHEAAVEWVETNMDGEVSCPGDINVDLAVNTDDFSEFLIQFGQTGPSLSADLDSDQDVDIHDFSEFLINFGNDCSAPLRSAPIKPKKENRDRAITRSARRS